MSTDKEKDNFLLEAFGFDVAGAKKRLEAGKDEIERGKKEVALGREEIEQANRLLQQYRKLVDEIHHASQNLPEGPQREDARAAVRAKMQVAEGLKQEIMREMAEGKLKDTVGKQHIKEGEKTLTIALHALEEAKRFDAKGAIVRNIHARFYDYQGEPITSTAAIFKFKSANEGKDEEKTVKIDDGICDVRHVTIESEGEIIIRITPPKSQKAKGIQGDIYGTVPYRVKKDAKTITIVGIQKSGEKTTGGKVVDSSSQKFGFEVTAGGEIKVVKLEGKVSAEAGKGHEIEETHGRTIAMPLGAFSSLQVI